MKISHLSIIMPGGNNSWNKRYRYLFDYLSDALPRIEVMESGMLSGPARYFAALRSFHFDRDMWRERFHKNQFAFVRKSMQTEGRLSKLSSRPDMVLQIHGMSCPAWSPSGLPYAMYLDYTMRLAEQEWPAWAPFRGRRDREDWLRCETQAYRNAAHLFAMSRLVKESLVSDYGICDGKISIVGASGHFRQPSRSPKPFHGNTLLFICSNFLRKGGDLLVTAFRQLRNEVPGLRLLAVGSDIPALDDVECLGYVSDERRMMQLFREADLLVMPSRCDPYPLSLIEAMNYGVPCLVTRASGMPEIVEDGVTGMVVDKDSPEQLAGAIQQILSDPTKWRSMSSAGRRQVEQQLNWRNVAKKMISVLEAL